MAEQEHRDSGAPEGADGGSAEQREDAKREGEATAESERSGPHWWELRPDGSSGEAAGAVGGAAGGAAYDTAGAAGEASGAAGRAIGEFDGASGLGASRGLSTTGGEEHIVTGAWGDGKTVADAQLLQAAAGREEPGSAGAEAGTGATPTASDTVSAGSAAPVLPSAPAAAVGSVPPVPQAPTAAAAADGAGGSGSALGERLTGVDTGARTASIARKTNETDIALTLAVDGTGRTDIATDVPFLNHMLDLFTKHGRFDLRVAAKGDVHIDDHHTVEDIGICIGQTLRAALGDKRGIKRYANVFIPMDEALAQVAIDISNRPHFEYRAQYPSARVGTFEVELVHEFLWKLAVEARITLHVIVHYGHNTHHMVEAVFKALGRALDEATSIDPRVQGVPSTKGVL
jgi:imidazoleglycerol-phosphate dehydratase